MKPEELQTIRERAEKELAWKPGTPPPGRWINVEAVPTLLDHIELLQARLDKVRALHVRGPGSSVGYTDAGYGYIEPYCAGCEASDEYAVSWPCATIRAIEEGE